MDMANLTQAIALANARTELLAARSACAAGATLRLHEQPEREHELSPTETANVLDRLLDANRTALIALGMSNVPLWQPARPAGEPPAK